MDPLLLDLVSFTILAIVELSLMYAIWNNLILKQISHYGFDAFVLFVGELINPKQARIVRNNPKLVNRLGIMLLIMALGGYFEIASLFCRDIWPNVH